MSGGILNRLIALAPLFLVIVTLFLVIVAFLNFSQTKKLSYEQYRPRVVAGYETSKKTNLGFFLL